MRAAAKKKPRGLEPDRLKLWAAGSLLSDA
jgi:hypothetical protein